MEAKQYYPVNEMVKMCGLKPKLDLFLRFVLYCLWLWVVNLENLTPLSFRPSPKTCFPLSGPDLKPILPQHKHRLYGSLLLLAHPTLRVTPTSLKVIALHIVNGTMS